MYEIINFNINSYDTRHGNTQIQRKVLRLLSIWEERQVFPKHVLANIHAIIKSKSNTEFLNILIIFILSFLTIDIGV